MSYSIMLDAGHGGRDPGAVYNGRREKDDTLSLTLAIGELLQEHGIASDTKPQGENPYEFYVSDAAESFRDFANAILPIDIDRAKKINIEEY